MRGRPLGPHGEQFASVSNDANSIYLCELTNGLIKVGFSNAPQRRLIGLSRQWGDRGARISRFQVFVGEKTPNFFLRDPLGNEKRAIHALCAIASPIHGHREYFAGIPFDAALAAVAQAVSA